MRELKFRAWDTKLEVMSGVIDITPSLGTMSTTYIYPTQILMQYTGLKDKNGKEIYEGDVVHSENEGSYPVGFDKAGCWVIEIYGERFNDDGSSTPRDESELLSNALADYGMEVIGNIYENPELLTN